MPTSKLMLARFHATYPEIVDEVSTVASIYDEVGDFAISEDPLVLEYWKKHGTWTVPPIFLHGNLLGESQDIIHLVEGYTRLGCLIGAYEYGIIDVAPTHKIFIGSIEKHT